MDRQQADGKRITRRRFLKVTGVVILAAGTGACGPAAEDEPRAPTGTARPSDTPVPSDTLRTGQVPVPADGIPPADGYLLVDIQKCQGCLSCMLACSLVHEGVESLSLSRIQVIQDSFASFPDDLTIEQCRQCVDPACVKVCPTGALKVDASHGHVRMVAEEECIGCGACFAACPYMPSRVFLVDDRAYDGKAKSRKCDLCANATYHWDEAGGGPDGKQACVAVCPVGAIVFTKEVPIQESDIGYKVDLREGSWASLGYPIN